jgi:hypothetical protein
MIMDIGGTTIFGEGTMINNYLLLIIMMSNNVFMDWNKDKIM